MDLLQFRHSQLIQKLEGRIESVEPNEFENMKQKLLSQLECKPDLKPLQVNIERLLANCSKVINELEILPRTILNHGIFEFKSHIQQILQCNQGDYQDLNDSIQIQKLRQKMKDTLLEVTDEIQRVYGNASDVCPHYSNEFLQVLNSLIQTYAYLRMNESSLVHRCKIPMKSFAMDKFTSDPKILRQDYFKDIILCPQAYKQYIHDNTYNSYLTIKQQILEKIRKLHTILFDKFEGFNVTINENRLLTTVLNRDSQKLIFYFRYLLHFHRESGKLTKTLVPEQNSQNSYKNIEKNYQKLKTTTKVALLSQQSVLQTQNTNHGFQTLLVLDQQIDKQLKDYEILKHIQVQLQQLYEDLKSELQDKIIEFNSNYIMTIEQEDQLNIEVLIEDLFQQLRDNLEKEQFTDPPEQENFLQNDNEFVKDAFAKSFTYDYKVSVSSILYDTSYLSQKPQYNNIQYSSFIKKREEERSLFEQQRKLDKDKALDAIRTDRQQMVHDHLSKKNEEIRNIQLNIIKESIETQQEVNKNLQLEQKLKYDLQEKKSLINSEKQSQQEEINQQRLLETQEKKELEKIRQQELKLKREEEKQIKKEELEQIKFQKEQQRKLEDHKKQREKNINEYQQDQARIFERKIIEIQQYRLKQEKQQKEQQQKEAKLLEDKLKAEQKKLETEEKIKKAQELKIKQEQEKIQREKEIYQKQQEIKQQQELERQLKQKEIEEKKRQQNINQYQKDQADIFQKLIQEFQNFRQNEAKQSISQYQLTQSEIFENKLKILEQFKEKQYKVEKFQKEQADIFEQKINDYKIFIEKQKLQIKNASSQFQNEQAEIFFIKLQQIKDHLNLEKKKKEDQENQRLLEEQQKLRIQEIQKQQQYQEEMKKEQDKIKQQELDLKKKKKEQESLQYQQDQANIFEMKIYLIQNLIQEANDKAQQKAQKDQYHIQQADIFNNQIIKIQQFKERQQQYSVYQRQQADIFEKNLINLKNYKKQIELQEQAILNSQRTKSQKSKKSEIYDSDEDLDIPEDIQFDEDDGEDELALPVKKNNQMLQDSEDYLRVSKDLYQPQERDESPFQSPDSQEEGVYQPLFIKDDLAMINQLINEYFKDQLSPSLDEYESFDAIMMLHEEFITTRKVAFLPIEFGQEFNVMLAEFMDELQKNGEEAAFERIEQVFQELDQNIQAFCYEQIEKVKFDPETRIIFPLLDYENNVFMVEINRLVQCIITYHVGDCENPLYMQTLIHLVSELFSIEEFGTKQAFIQSESILQSHTPYMFFFQIRQYLLVTFCAVYELDMYQILEDSTALLIDKDLENRLNITLTTAQQLQAEIEQDQEAYINRIEEIIQQSEQEQRHVIRMESIQADESQIDVLQQRIAQEVDLLMDYTTHLDSGFLMLEILFGGEEKYTFYASTELIGQQEQHKFLLSFYMIEGYPEDLTKLVSKVVSSLENAEFSIQIYMDFARQSTIYEMGKICFGLWIGLVDRNELDANTAFKMVSYNNLPSFILMG